MKYPVYSIRDEKVGFGQPQLQVNEPAMIRQFAYQINEPNSILEFSPKDYSLYEIGEFDTDAGTFTSVLPRFIIAGTEVYGVNAK